VNMKAVTVMTLKLPKKLKEDSQKYAQENDISLSALIRKCLSDVVERNKNK